MGFFDSISDKLKGGSDKADTVAADGAEVGADAAPAPEVCPISVDAEDTDKEPAVETEEVAEPAVGVCSIAPDDEETK